MTAGETSPDPLPPVDHIQRTRDQYAALGYPPYTWVQESEPPPFAPLHKPLSECRLGVVSSGGVYQAGQVAFHYKDDISLRVIDSKTPASELRATHFAYDLTDARRDPNVVLPLAALNALVAEGELAELSSNAYTFMGGIYSARKVREQIAPELARRFIRDEVDVVLLVPVWPVCHQSVGLIARHLEAQGIPTLSMSSAHSITASVNPPRAAFLDFPLGHTAGRPDELAEQKEIMRAALALFNDSARGEITSLPFEWSADHSWKDEVMAGDGAGDDRVERFSEPQYQTAEDEVVADVGCPSCIWLER